MFEIRITETKDVRKTQGKLWALCGKEGEAEYGYTPEVEKVIEVETEIYKQCVEVLEISKVINAINGTYI